MTKQTNIKSLDHKVNEKKTLADDINRVWKNKTSRDGKWPNRLRAVKLVCIRGITRTMKFKWPLTVIVGKNGSGKTTFLQACVLAPEGTKENKLPPPGFLFPKHLEWETPVAINGMSRIYYIFSNRNWNYTRELGKSNWKALPKKGPSWSVKYRPLSADMPAQESFGERVRSSRSTRSKPPAKVSDETLDQLSRILGMEIDAYTFGMIGKYPGTRTPPNLGLKKGGVDYTDRNAGGGEQKALRYIVELTQLPENSLILLEEPEVTLHPDLHRRLAMFLMWLCLEKRHQIIITTHSSELFRCFPREARVSLERSNGNVHVEYGVERFQVERELTGAVYTNKDIMLVEDSCAKYFLDTILEHDLLLREQSCVVVFGDKDVIGKATRILHESGIRVVGIRDPDVGENQGTFLLSLPASPLNNKTDLWNRIEVQWLSDENLTRVAAGMPRIKRAYEDAKSRCVKYRDNGIDYYKEVFKALYSEMGMSEEELSKVLSRSWLEAAENRKMADGFLERVRRVLAEAMAA